MNILFAADMSFNYIPTCADEETVRCSVAEVAEKFAEADYSIVNLENILGNKEDYEPIIKSGPNLISSDCFISYIKALNPSVVGLANNHTGDYGEAAIYHTLDLLKQNGYPYIGAGSNIEEAYKPCIVEGDGVKVGIIAVCENEFGGAGVDKAGSAGYSLGRLAREIKKLEESNCKSVVYFHGGNETNPLPSPGKKELYRHFIDVGASAVVAMHTHCPQGWEIYDGKPIIYSMGNFFFPHASKCLKSWYYGYMVSLAFRENEVTPTIIPYCFDSLGVTLLKGDELAAFDQYLTHISGIIADDSLLQQYFDAWCSKYGHDYSKRLSFDDSLIKGQPKEITSMRNLFSCEAHAELLKGFLNLCYEDRVDAAMEKLEEIEKLQGLEVPTGFVLPEEASTAEAYIKAFKSQCETLADEEIIDGIQMLSDKRIEEIRNTQTTVEVIGTKYYVAEDGNDSNDGLSPEKPWKTLQKVTDATLNPGDGVFFKRGDIFTGQIEAKAGVTYSAYDKGKKPRLYGSTLNSADASFWQETEIENIWVYYIPISEDIGNIVFDETSNARKIYRSIEADGKRLDYYTGREFNTWKDLEDNLSFYHDHDVSDKVYLRCDEGNPGDLYEEIRLIPKKPVIRVSTNNNVTIDNLHLAYGNFGVSAASNDGLTLQNCEINWIGGCIQVEAGKYSANRTYPTPYGNGIEIYGEAKNFTVDNCYFWQIYDAAMTHQGKANGDIAVDNVRYTNNVVEKAVYAIEIFYGNSPDESDVRSFNGTYIENNILRMGGGFGHFARPDQGVTALIRNGGLMDNTTNYVVKNNIFDRSMCKIIQARCDGGSKAMYYDNIYVQKRGLIFANRFGQEYLADEELPGLLADTHTEHNPTYIFLSELG